MFENSRIQLMADSQCEAQSRIQALLEYLHEREMDLEAIAESKRERLEQLVQLRNFEVEARQVLHNLNHIGLKPVTKYLAERFNHTLT